MLRNARHECLAQEVAKGAKLEDAHRAAGLAGNRKSAWKIRQRSDVTRRIEELLDQREQVEAKGVERAIGETALSQTAIIRMLVADRELAREKGQVAAAIRAAELLGKIIGIFIDRREQGGPGDFAHLSDAELDEQLMMRLTERGLTAEQASRFLITAPKPRNPEGNTVQ